MAGSRGGGRRGRGGREQGQEHHVASGSTSPEPGEPGARSRSAEYICVGAPTIHLLDERRMRTPHSALRTPLLGPCNYVCTRPRAHPHPWLRALANTRFKLHTPPAHLTSASTLFISAPFSLITSVSQTFQG